MATDTDPQSDIPTRRRRFLKGLGVAGGAALIAGCTGGNGDSGGEDDSETTQTTQPGTDSDGGPVYGGDLSVAIRREAQTLHPAFGSTDVSSFQVLSHVFDGYAPYDYGANQNTPGLLTEWDWVDDVTLEATVREGVQFHKGYGELTASDLVYQTNRILDETLPDIWLYTGLIDRAEQVDTYTLRWHFNQPYVPFEWSVLGTAKVGSKAAMEEMGDEAYAQNPIGTGPFVFEEWVEGSHIILRKNEAYWDDALPYLDSITYRFVPEADTQLSMLETGEIDVLDRTSFRDIKAVKENPDIKTKSTEPGWNFYYLQVGGHSNERAELKDPDVRKAVQFAIDRTAVANVAFSGEAEPDDDPLPSSLEAKLPGSEISVYPLEPDIEQAKTHLERAGFADGLAVELIHESATEDARGAQIIASSLGDAGIDVRLNQVDGGTFVDRWLGGTFDMVYGSIDLGYPDPDASIFHFLHSEQASANSIAYSNPEVDALLEQERATLDQDERMGMIRDAITTYLEDDPGYAYTHHANAVRSMQPNIHIEGTLAPQQHLLNFNRAWKQP